MENNEIYKKLKEVWNNNRHSYVVIDLPNMKGAGRMLRYEDDPDADIIIISDFCMTYKDDEDGPDKDVTLISEFNLSANYMASTAFSCTAISKEDYHSFVQEAINKFFA